MDLSYLLRKETLDNEFSNKFIFLCMWIKKEEICGHKILKWNFPFFFSKIPHHIYLKKNLILN